MGQYFVIVNLDKKEYIRPTLLKLWEIIANNDVRILGYLLATNNPDGTYLVRYFSDPKEVDASECEVYYYNEGIGYCFPKLKYFGRWCGDRIAIVGDYSDQAENWNGPSYDEILKTFKDVTEEAVEEYNKFIDEMFRIGI